jgi:hypothetical protein
MQFSRVSPRCTASLLLLVIAAASCGSTAMAAEPIRWKLKAGDKFNYDMNQDTTMNMNAGPAGQMVTTVQQKMEMTWDVQQVNEAGDAVIKQSFDRVTMNMNAPMGQTIEYDSDAAEPAEGLATMIAPLYDAMTEGEFEVTMSARGEIRDVKIPQEVIDAIKNSPGAAAMGEMATSEGFQNMIMQGALVLPEEPPAVGESWSNTATMNNPMAGKVTVETSYKYEGTKEVDGISMAVFRPTLKMGMEGNPTVQMKVTEQQSEGEVLFNQEAGRLDSTSLQQTTKMDITVAGQTMQQQIDQLIEVKVTQAEGSEVGGRGSEE